MVYVKPTDVAVAMAETGHRRLALSLVSAVMFRSGSRSWSCCASTSAFAGNLIDSVVYGAHPNSRRMSGLSISVK